MASVFTEHPNHLIATRRVTARHEYQQAAAIIAGFEGDILLAEIRLEAIGIEPLRHGDPLAVEVEFDRPNLGARYAFVYAESHAPIHLKHAQV